MRNLMSTFAAATFASTLVAVPACAANQTNRADPERQTGDPTAASRSTTTTAPAGSDRQGRIDVVTRADDGEWLSLTGEVKSVEADRFTLNWAVAPLPSTPRASRTARWAAASMSSTGCRFRAGWTMPICSTGARSKPVRW